ncbi:unnamed protein product [Citrullus colocynthis]|uniref:Uncharacterized protein n=1 Tax=Citrullus colocynthis TaxID=252529 RepID=A0ABP0XSV9_9ROSI
MLKDIILVKLVVFREMVKKKKMIVEITKSILLQYSMPKLLGIIMTLDGKSRPKQRWKSIPAVLNLILEPKFEIFDYILLKEDGVLRGFRRC